MDYYVKKQTAPLESESPGKVFSTIQQAAEPARPGDAIWIGEGIYTLREAPGWMCRITAYL